MAGVRGKNKQKLQRKSGTKSREKGCVLDSHKDPFLKHICVSDPGFLEHNIGTCVYHNLPLSFFFAYLSR